MKVKVTKDFITIIEKDFINIGEYKVHKCYFDFDEEYDELVKKAIFVREDIRKEIPIIENQCYIPHEVLRGYEVELRVYGYYIENEELKIRYSPKFVTFTVGEGSYIPGVSASEEITPTQFEQYEKALQDGLSEVDTLVNDANEIIKKLNIDSSFAKKQGKYAQSVGDKLKLAQESGLFNGIGLEYEWSDTSLGIKRENEEIYSYSNLKGDDYVISNEDYQEIANIVQNDIETLSNLEIEKILGGD